MSEYQRAYSKGYATGQRSADARLAEARLIADESVARAERAEAQQGYGNCRGCRYWTWGGNGAQWGTCQPPDARYINRAALWIRSDTSIQTSATFGCVLYAASCTPEGGS